MPENALLQNIPMGGQNQTCKRVKTLLSMGFQKGVSEQKAKFFFAAFGGDSKAFLPLEKSVFTPRGGVKNLLLKDLKD